MAEQGSQAEAEIGRSTEANYPRAEGNQRDQLANRGVVECSGAGASVCNPSMFECSICMGSLGEPSSIEIRSNANTSDVELLAPVRAIADPPLFFAFEPRGALGLQLEQVERQIQWRHTGLVGLDNIWIQGVLGSPPRRLNAQNTQRNQAIDQLASMDRSVIAATQCGHVFHQICVKKWSLEQKKALPVQSNEHSFTKINCPTCRNTGENLLTLYLTPESHNDPQPSTSSPPTAEIESVPARCGKGEDECRDLQRLHSTLVEDFQELNRRHLHCKDREDELRALYLSGKDLIDAQEILIQQLREEISSLRSTAPDAQTDSLERSGLGPGGVPAKRPREDDI